MKILLARHGRTRWNVEEVFRGRADIELDETGIRQAELLGEYLKNYPLEAIFTSPLKRALKTAELIAVHHGGHVKVCPEIIDMDFGTWEGLPFAEVQNKYPAEMEDWFYHPERVRAPGGESLEDVRQRALGFLEKRIAREMGNIALVSHGVVHKILILGLLGLDTSFFGRIWVDTCGLTTFSRENNSLVLVEHNNTSFLKPLKGKG